ncbi:MAG: RecX family transcriptional regulator [Sporolactobacillus sp.]
MPVIARIRTNEKAKGFYEVSVTLRNGAEQTLTVHEDLLVQDELHKGKELSDAQYTKLEKEAQGIRAYHAGIRYLSYRMRSIHEMRVYLQRKEYEENQIIYAINRFKKEKLLDDKAFAASFTRTRIELSTKGPQMIYRELLQAGVAQDIAAETESLFPFELQLAHARKYLAKQTASVKNKKSMVESRQVLARLLMQRGYAHDISRQVLDELSDFLKENEKNALTYQAEKAMQKYKKFSGSEFSRKVKAYLFRKGFPIDEITGLLEERLSSNQ